MKLQLITSALLTAGLTSISVAQTERDLGAHEHGAASLNVALQDNLVIIELDSPWNNLIGFEHAPSTDEQHAMVDDAMALLNTPASLFSFVGTDCTPTETSIESTLETSDHDDDHKDEHSDNHDEEHKDEHAHGDEHKDEHDHDHEHKDEHDHDHKHEHEHKDEHGHEHEEEHKDEHDHDDHGDDHAGHDHDGEVHSEVLGSYTFECADVDQLTAINADLLTTWDGIEDLTVQLVGPFGQMSTMLTAERSELNVTAVK